jgi:hypothetical protein
MLPHAARCSCVLQPVHRMKLLPICAVNLVSRTALGSLRLHSSTETHKSVRRMTSASKVSAAQSLRPPITGLEKIQNIRDLAEASCKVQPGRIFRSACPNVASTSDITLLRKQLGVQQLVQLLSTFIHDTPAWFDESRRKTYVLKCDVDRCSIGALFDHGHLGHRLTSGAPWREKRMHQLICLSVPSLCKQES